MSTHALYSPSKLPALALCPGWQSDPEPGPMAIRGTAVHALLADIVRGKVTVVPPELLGPVDSGTDLLDSLRARFPDHAWEAEVKLDTGIPDCYGTGDLVGASDWSVVGVVADWKTGRGERPDAGKSLQTAAYAVALFKRHPHLEQVMVIMAELEQQPTECLFTRADLSAAAHEIARVILAAQEATAADWTPSPKACQYCARRESCGPLASSVKQTMAVITANDPRTIAHLSPVEVAGALKQFGQAAKLVEDFMETLRDRAKALLAAGTDVPGFALKESNGGRGWTAPPDVVEKALVEWMRNHGPAGTGAPSIHALASPADMEARLATFLGAEKGAKAKAKDAIAGLCAPAKRKSLVEVDP